MKTEKEHTVEFICINDDSLILFDLFDPPYIYKVGDKITIDNSFDSQGFIELEVTDVKHIIRNVIVADQITKIFVKKLESSPTLN